VLVRAVRTVRVTVERDVVDVAGPVAVRVVTVLVGMRDGRRRQDEAGDGEEPEDHRRGPAHGAGC
jgi:hypothetical protein